MMGQKEAVVLYVRELLPTFVSGKDHALTLLGENELARLKHKVCQGLLNGDIAYSKSRTNTAEVLTYARSMVMNHLKKAKELNGGVSTHQSKAKAVEKQSDPYSDIDMDSLPDVLKEYVKTLI